jgi:hypothetical protein
MSFTLTSASNFSNSFSYYVTKTATGFTLYLRRNAGAAATVNGGVVPATFDYIAIQRQ